MRESCSELQGNLEHERPTRFGKGRDAGRMNDGRIGGVEATKGSAL